MNSKENDLIVERSPLFISDGPLELRPRRKISGFDGQFVI